MQGSAEAEASGASSPFLTEHADIIGWLDVLLKGKSEDQARARTEIAMILEERGFADDAEEAYWTNIQAKSGDRRAYDRLIALYQQRRDRLSESLVRRKLEEISSGLVANPAPASIQPFSFGQLGADNGSGAGQSAATTRPSGSNQPATGQSASGQTGARPVRRLRSGAKRSEAGPTPERADNPRLRAVPAPGTAPVKPLGAGATPKGMSFDAQLAAAGHVAAEPVAPAAKPGWRIARKDTTLPAPSTTPTGSVQASPVAQTPSTGVQAAALAIRAATPAAQAPVVAAIPTAYANARPAETADVEQVDLRDRARRRRYSSLSPNPGRKGFTLPTGGLIVLQPTTIAAFLLASVGAAMVISFAIIMMDRGTGTPVAAAALQPQVASAAGQVPARCTDGTLRFPLANDPRAAVVAAYKAHGIDVDAPKPGGPRLTADQATLVVGGWMAISLMMEHSGQQPPSLVEWLDPSSDRTTLANAILAGRSLDSMLTADEWATMRSWPAASCEGAFMRDPRNAGLMKQIERVITK